MSGLDELGISSLPAQNKNGDCNHHWRVAQTRVRRAGAFGAYRLAAFFYLAFEDGRVLRNISVLGGFMALCCILNVAAIFGVLRTGLALDGLDASAGSCVADRRPILGSAAADCGERRDMRVLWAKRDILGAGVVMVLCSVWGFDKAYANAPRFQTFLISPLFWAVSAVVWPFIRSSR